MIKKLLVGLTFRRVVVALLVLLGIGFVVQQSPRFSYAGHVPFATPAARAWLTLVLCLLWIFAYGLVTLVRRLDRVRITWEPAPAEAPPVQRDDGPLLDARERLDSLFRSMRRALRAGGPAWRLGRHSLYRLPWYLVLGGAGSGRTALLSSSRIDWSPAGDDAEWKPGDPCRFWLNDRLLLIEAGGTPAADEAAAGIEYAIWRRLLGHLRGARRQHPVNGAILTVSVADILGGEEHAVARARHIRTRLREMQRRLGRPCPVYLVVTQCDRLAGFDAFFAHLERAASEQVWGVTFTGATGQGDDTPLAAFAAEFAALARRLQDRVVHLAAAADSRQAAAIYGFPAQFEALGEPLSAYLSQAFSRSVHAPAFWLRGVYFTSATHDGSAIPSAASPLAAVLRDEPARDLDVAARRDGYFITGLLRDVILRESGLARRAAARMRWRLSRYLASVAVVVACALAVGLLLEGYQRNRALMAAMQADTAQLSALANAVGTEGAAGQLPGMLALLDEAKQPVVPQAVSLMDAILLRGSGLYQGDKLTAAMRAEYRRLLRLSLLPFIQARARLAMMDTTQNDQARFRALRTYLMLGDREHYDADTVLAWVAANERDLALDDAHRADLLAHAQALFAGPDFDSDVSSDPAVVAAVRADLAARPLADLLYNTLQSKLRAAAPDTLSVTQLEGPHAPLVLQRPSGLSLSDGVPGLYTQAGYRFYPSVRDQLIADIARDAWVLDTRVGPADAVQLREALDRRYFSAYIAAWDALLKDVRVGRMPAEARDTAAELHVLAGADSPFRRFLQGVAAQTTLAGKGDPATPVGQHFQALHQLFQAHNGSAAPIAQIQAGIEGEAAFLDAVDAARQRGLPVPPSQAISTLQDLAEGQPAALADTLRQLAEDGKAVAARDARRGVDESWRADVAPFCHAAVDGRYPIDPLSGQDMTRDDFERLFAPGGLLDTFFQTNLLSYADTAGNPWRWRPNGARLGLTPAALRMFQDAATIRQAFFPTGGKTVSVDFQLLPLSLDPYFVSFDLTLGNQSLKYAHGPAVSTGFAWPGNGAPQSGRIGYEPADPSGFAGRAVRGPWALFRLIGMGRLQRQTANRYTLDFDLAGKHVSLELDAGSVVNPFNLAALNRFRCLDVLVSRDAPGS